MATRMTTRLKSTPLIVGLALILMIAVDRQTLAAALEHSTYDKFGSCAVYEGYTCADGRDLATPPGAAASDYVCTRACRAYRDCSAIVYSGGVCALKVWARVRVTFKKKEDLICDPCCPAPEPQTHTPPVPHAVRGCHTDGVRSASGQGGGRGCRLGCGWHRRDVDDRLCGGGTGDRLPG